MEYILAPLGFYAWVGKTIWPQMVVLIGTMVGLKICLLAFEWLEQRIVKGK